MQRGSVLPVLIILIVVLGLIGGYFYQIRTNKESFQKDLTTSSAETNLNKFTSNKLKIEFEYINNLTVKEDTEAEFNKRGNGDFRKNFTSYVTYPPADLIGGIVVLDETSSYETNPLTIWVFNNSNNLTIDKWYENFWYYPFVWGDYTERRNNVAPTIEATVSGQLVKYGVVTYQPGEPKFIYLSNNNKMYLFRVIGENGYKILQSVKFIN